MKKTMKRTILLLMVATSFMSTAHGAIHCQTPREGKVFKIDERKVTFMVEGFSSRLPASIGSVRTRKTNTGFTKVVSFEGHKHTIHIENESKFSELDDYLVIRSRKGHEVTYPITCKRK